MPQKANDWANISDLVQIEAMYQGMHTVYEQSIQVVNFKMDYHFPRWLPATKLSKNNVY